MTTQGKGDTHMDEIEELYNGRLFHAEQFGFSDNPEWRALHNQTLEIENQLLNELNDEQKNIYTKIKSLIDKADYLEQDRMFHFAFRLGCRLTIDIYNNEENPSNL